MRDKKITEPLDCAKLEEECPQTYNKVNLYRGISNLSGKCGKTLVNKRRTPRNSSLEYHLITNNIFYGIFGIPLRSATVFCTGDKDEASDYGELCKIYPADDFTVYWSEIINDLYNLDRSKNLLQNPDYSPFIAIHCLVAAIPDLRSSRLIEHSLETWPLAKKFLCSFYPDYLDNYPASAIQTTGKILHDHPDEINDFFLSMYKKGRTIEDLQAASLSQNEIMIDCQFYCWEKC